MLKIAALLLASVAAFTSSAQAADVLKVAIAQRGFWNSTFIDIGLKLGYFKEENLEIEALYTQGGASTLQPLIAGSVDIAMSNGILGVIAAYSKGMPVRIISAEATGAAEAFWYAKRDSGIKTIKDTEGKTVAFSSPGSSTNLIILQLMQQENVKPKLVATGGLPSTLTQVMTGQVDVGWAVPPFVLQHLSDGTLHIIARGSDVKALQEQTIRVNVANANTLKTKRDAYIRFVRALNRSIQWAYANNQSIDDYATLAKVPRDQALRTRDEFFPIKALQLSEIKGLELTLKQAHEYKYTATLLSPKDVAGLLDILHKPK